MGLLISAPSEVQRVAVVHKAVSGIAASTFESFGTKQNWKL